ncbi:MAG: hypothetical protein OHK0046_11790 [Anaerolineae bacterium]
MPELWNVLHDGAIMGIQGSVPGDIRLVVMIPYLKELWAEAEDYLIIDLHGCTVFEWHVFGKDDETVVFQDLTAIANSRPKIRTATAVDKTILLYTRGSVAKQRGATHPLWEVQGELRIRYDSMAMYLNTVGTDPLPLEEVRDRAAAYWSRNHK